MVRLERRRDEPPERLVAAEAVREDHRAAPSGLPVTRTAWRRRTSFIAGEHSRAVRPHSRPRGAPREPLEDVDVGPLCSGRRIAQTEQMFYTLSMRPEYREEPCRTALNRVKGMMFRWSLNPYTGCAHQCTFCYVRAFERRADRPSDDRYGTSIRVKTNVAEVLRRELARKAWKGELVAVGAATDPYQPAEGRYRLTRGCLEPWPRPEPVLDHHPRPDDRPRRRRPGRGRARAKCR